VQPDRWQQVAALCGEALEVPATDRTAFLRKRCGDDQALRGEVESLLSVADKPGLLDFAIAPEEFKPSAVIAGRFRIVRLIGRGGMGEVYQAEDLQMGGHIALKTIRPELLNNPQSTELFKREIQLAKKVTNPNVCRIYDVGFHPSSGDPDARMFLTMELLEGRTLSNRLTEGPMSTAEALPLIQQMADALGAAHRAGIVHRDFKSGNVMLAAHPAGTRAVVMDFGLARTAAQSQSAHTNAATETLGAVGTPEYMAPEQLTGGAITPATDIYALGIVIYEMVTGSRPFQGQTPFDVAIRRLHETPPSPRQLAPGLEPRWEKTILRCLSRRPEERFQSTSDVVLALSGQAESRGAPLRRGWLVSIAGALAILAVAAVALLLRSPKQRSMGRVEWEQLTNYSDAVTDPALSPDGRMLAFKRGGSWFMSSGQIYVKLLPDGQPVQLTHDSFPKMAPAFSPDGSRVGYTEVRPGGRDWEIWEASILQGGGEPRQMLTNGEGLTWIDKQHVLFSEQRDSPLMVVVTSTESRTASRDVYVPQDVRGMAHFSALSPDHKQVLIVEMELGFSPCRLAPFDGSSKGQQVGPVPSSCIAAGWSPDGKWMYFSARRPNDKVHLWRERTEGGEPEQITSGPTEEEGLAVAPDGRSLITSVGVDQTTVWIHDANGEHQISGEGDAESPQFAPDGKKVYYLATPDLWVTELASGHAERVLPGVAVTRYALSPDGKAVAYTTTDGSLWFGELQRGAPPRKLAPQGRRVEFSTSGDIFFRTVAGSVLYRIHPDGTGIREVPGNPGHPLHPVSPLSPDEEWTTNNSGDGPTLLLPRNGGHAIALCEGCYAGWTLDGKFFWITLPPLSGQSAVTGLIPLRNKSMIPPLPGGGVRTQADLMKIPGVQVIPSPEASPAPDGASYAFTKEDSRWNLYRIPLP
jgi:Tol biopolymer transport system component